MSRAGGVLEAKKADAWVDDTLPLAAVITQHDVDKSVVTYTIRVTRAITEETWTIPHRYSEFGELHSALQALFDVPMELPPKKYFGNLDQQFILERQKALQEYLDQLLAFSPAQFSLPLRAFLDPSHYPRPFIEDALLGLSMFLRSEPTWQIVEPLPLLGSRLRKSYFIVNNTMDSSNSANVRKVLTWNPIGKPMLAPQDVVASALKYVAGIEHPFILPALVGTLFEGEAAAAIVVREFCPKGSLKDLILRNKAVRSPYHRKYPPGARGRPLDPRLLQLFGRQILEALKFLHDKSIPYGHLHSGNVIVVADGVCRLTDVESGLLSLPARTRAPILQLKTVRTLQQMDVYCFGLVLYEMATGAELATPTVEHFPPNTPAASLLQRLVTSEGVRNLPSVAELLSESFFVQAAVPAAKPAFKASARVKEALVQMTATLESLIQRHQGVVDDAKKASKEEARRASKEPAPAGQRKSSKRTNSIEVSSSADFSRGSSASFATATPSSSSASAAASTSSTFSSPPPPPAPAPAPAPAASRPPSAPAAPAGPRSSSSAQSAPPAPPPPPAPAAPSSSGGGGGGGGDAGRSSLLSSIRGFGGGLKKTVTNDRSAPKP